MTANAQGMEDFIFGSLSTDSQRLEQMRAARNGFTCRAAMSPQNPEPGQAVRVEVNAGPAHLIESVTLYYTLDGNRPDPSTTHTLNLSPSTIEWDTLLWGYVRRFSGEIRGQPEGTTVRFVIGGRTPSGEQLWADDGRQHSYVVDRQRVPSWVKDSVIYHIFMDRFAPAPGAEFASHSNISGIYGGTISGVLARLDYLSDLGVNCLWLSPVFPSPSHHRYDATDFRDIDPRLGTRADLKALIDEAHRRDMRVLLDFVPNHTSSEHPYFVQARRDAASPYRDYYTFTNWPNDYKTFFGVRSLPQINNDYLPARRYVIDSAVYWLQEFGVDGFRLDYAHGPSHDFWTDYYTAVKKTNPDSFHVGEIVETPALLRTYEGLLDGALDFLWLQAVRKLVAYGSLDVARFEQFLSAHEAYFGGRNFVLPTFVDNHDMNRFLWVTRGDVQRLRLAAVCQFTLAAPPIIYYGTEVGLSQLRDTRQGNRGILEESRLPMPWDGRQDNALHSFYKKLIAMRRSSTALRYGQRRLITADAATGRYGYTRQSGDETVVVLLNVASTAQNFTLPGDAERRTGSWRDMMNDQAVTGSATLEPYGYLVARQS